MSPDDRLTGQQVAQLAGVTSDTVLLGFNVDLTRWVAAFGAEDFGTSYELKAVSRGR